MASAGYLDDAHAAAIRRAYELVGLAQGQNVGAEIGVAEEEAAGQGWTDVRLLLNWARTMAARETGLDNAEYLRAMLDLAETTGETSLLALALATAAARRTELKRALDVTESTATPLVRAVALLDEESGPVVHRAAALIEVGVATQELGFWELASNATTGPSRTWTGLMIRAWPIRSFCSAGSSATTGPRWCSTGPAPRP